MNEFVGLKPFAVSASCAALGANVIASLPAPGVGKEYVIFNLAVTCTDTGVTAILKAGADNFWTFVLATGAMKEVHDTSRMPWRTGDNKALTFNLSAAKNIAYSFYIAVDAVKP